MSQIPQSPRLLPAAACTALAGALAACLYTGAAEAAVVDITPYAQYNWESDHNPFFAPDANSGATLNTRPNVDEKVSTLVAGLNLKHGAGDISTYVTGEGRRVAYSTFDTFNHTEYTATLGHKREFQTGSKFGIEFGAARQFTPFDILAADTPIAYQTRRYGRVNGTLRFATRNVFDAAFERAYQRLPIAGASDYNTVQSNLQVGYGRLVGTATTIGVRAGGTAGSQIGNGATTQFRQVTPEAYLKYSRAGLMDLDAAIGATHRTQEGTTGMKAMVGNVRLQYSLTPKTALRAGVVRQVTGYYVVGGSQATTTWSAGINWQPTERLGVVFDAGRMHGLYELPQPATNRTDDSDFEQLAVNWKPARWLTLSAFGQLQKRSSTSVDYRFDANSVGVSVKVQRPQ
jgi:hypothetical protein